ncbi:MAG: ABC transporter permease [Nitrospirae bacterium]|nr:ABC transporter permease [Nitrospirota bacterium]
MAYFLLKKTLVLALLLIGVTGLAFVVLKTLPGDPATGLLGQHAEESDVRRISEELGTKKPVLVQYAGYLRLLGKGEMGRSYYTKRRVATEIGKKLPNTLRLAVAASIVAALAGIAVGLICGFHAGALPDKLLYVVSLAGLSMPVFWSGLLLMLFFSLKLHLLPPSGTGGIVFLILPAITLSLPTLSTVARITRASVIEAMDMPFVRVLRAKGLRDNRIMFVHALSNALIPVVTIVGLDFGSFLNGAVLTETIFGWDGIGRFIVEGVLKRDYPVIIGCILTGTVIFVFINALVDVLYNFIDPRIRVTSGK